MSKLDRNDLELIEDFQNQAKALAPHHPELHDNIDPDAFERGGLSLSDIEDYIFTTHGEYLGGMAAIINATIDLGIDAADQAGVKS